MLIVHTIKKAEMPGFSAMILIVAMINNSRNTSDIFTIFMRDKHPYLCIIKEGIFLLINQFILVQPEWRHKVFLILVQVINEVDKPLPFLLT